ncbi:MAG: hypothetical protein J7604_22725 [Sporocytophaga sp.]|uniref:hypothetical protein n=1 Tax=Sporocytophaga sp. TaxID=2231183 RepID=UPI001B022081|nr:hypothetical protein [Sporocytophaga sp.]MBO9703047.1 hypothetical protein [Sporocytophaga sp.]
MLATIRKYKRPISIFFLFNFITGALPYRALALTSGPSQPETQQFAPAGMDNMVDPFTGDFSYNIPLMDVGGYPINLNYAAGITPDAEASWVGLGWNVNVGAINRNVRGLPDDFAGDEVETVYNVKPNQTFGLNFSFNPAKLEAWGFKVGLTQSMNLFYNNYNGFGFGMGIRPSIDLPLSSKSKYKVGLGVDFNMSSEDGASITPSVGLGPRQDNGRSETGFGANLSFPYSTREGLKGMSLSTSYSYTGKDKAGKATERSGGHDSFMGFAFPTYTPSVSHDLINTNATLNLSFELSNEAVEQGLLGIGGYYSGQFLKSTSKKNPAYGYMYSGLDGQSDDAMHDFNREKDGGGFNDATKNLALTNYTYDIFSVSGQGVGGSYRLFRGDVGNVGDPINIEENHVGELGVGFGSGSTPSMKVNVDVKYSHVGTVSSRWSNGQFQNFNDPTADYNTAREMVYFKKIGETAPETDGDFLNNVQKGSSTLGYNLISNDGMLDGSMFDKKKPNIGNASLGQNNKRQVRRKRNNQFTYITAGEAFNKYSLMPIRNHHLNEFDVNTNTSSNSYSRKDNVITYVGDNLDRIDQYRKGHHITEIRVTDNGGSRYCYGIPVYNNYQEEVTFAVDATTKADPKSNAIKKNLVEYSSTEASTGNTSGIDRSYNKVTTGAHATSYLLTCILSSDYVDSDNIPGPSDGDLGNYTKFNYVRTSQNFQWRTPYQENMASFTDGLETKDNDDKANYLYGKKEVWYLHSIETRTHVAEFHLSPRKDGRGVKSSSGGLSTSTENTLYKLDKIDLFSKADKLNGSKEPVKTVHFKYDYTLCPKTPNSSATLEEGEGKLTLKKVWFTYGLSGKGVLNPYAFDYSDYNPAYNLKEYDRWGNYKAQSELAGTFGNEAFPYTDQDTTLQDKQCAAYSLTKIYTPTGGTIQVHYESDDYAYVQDKRAMRMFKIIGFSRTNSSAPNNTLFDITDGGLAGKMFLHVDLGEGFTARDANHANEILRKEYLDGINLMYYKAKLNVINDPNPLVQDKFEYVPGYTEINISGSIAKNPLGGNKYTTAIIQLIPDKTKGSNSRNINPIVRNGWMFAKMNLGRELKGLGDAETNGVMQVIKTMIAQADNILSFFAGFASVMEAKGNSNTIESNKSFVRLNDVDKKKLGGGHRVKAVIMSDNWNMMGAYKETTSNGNKEVAYYGQKYDYVTNELSNVLDENGKPTKRPISSGVASYEPMVGNDENPFRLPVFSIQKLPLAPSREFYLEEPFGEMFFPSPTVGYTKVVTTPVKVLSGNYDVEELEGNGTGFVEQEFYTAKDFPTITERTELKHKRDKPNLILNFLKVGATDIVTCSQGYKVELNDMHGKEKSKKVMPEVAGNETDVQPISYVEYRYKKNTDGSLSNSVRYINPTNLAIENESINTQLGVDVDIVHDTKYYKSVTAGGGLDFNVKGIFPVIPIVGVIPMPTWNLESTEFKSVVTTKVINRIGILEKTIAMDNGQTITTENLAWDKETGEVLLTKVDNEFHDPIWTFNYPGYWAYDEMKLAYNNEGIIYRSGGNFTLDNFKTAFLNDGDELLCESSGGYKLGYYDNNRYVTTGKKIIIDKDGNEITGITRIKIIRSGLRNVAMTPIGSISCMDDPLANNVRLQFSRVINAGATEFKFIWKAFCNCLDDKQVAEGNPFVLGKRGSLRSYKAWTYLTERYQANVNNNVDIKRDGYFSDTFIPFWTYAGSKFDKVNNIAATKWQSVVQIENYNQIGMEIENKDALDRYSMAQFGYGRNLPTATSNNSRYQESAFDGFEDYDYGDCNDDHFSWRSQNPTITHTESHTGRSAIQVPPKSSKKINKIIDPCNPTSAQ